MCAALEITTIRSFKTRAINFIGGGRGGLSTRTLRYMRYYSHTSGMRVVKIGFKNFLLMLAIYTVDTLIEHTHTHFDLLTVCELEINCTFSGKFKQGGAPCFWYAAGNADLRLNSVKH